MAEHLAKQLPNSKLIEISNAGHLWIMENIKVVLNELISDDYQS